MQQSRGRHHGADQSSNHYTIPGMRETEKTRERLVVPSLKQPPLEKQHNRMAQKPKKGKPLILGTTVPLMASSQAHSSEQKARLVAGDGAEQSRHTKERGRAAEGRRRGEDAAIVVGGEEEKLLLTPLGRRLLPRIRGPSQLLRERRRRRRTYHHHHRAYEEDAAITTTKKRRATKQKHRLTDFGFIYTPTSRVGRCGLTIGAEEVALDAPGRGRTRR
ncbi:hypothetical protein CRG98_026783 [Punica granatum]|uniref:Uncharacterized protein n=1 Tax=Punica granatum TaxID=22663 RepID=A0A2I0J9A6_PUNGR|nr:hypothetical protein CRG98_026783 [Punica granatum]